MKSKLRAAFETVCSSFSPDRVVADPELNVAFLNECQQSGLTASAAALNRMLLNLRKEGNLRGLKSIRTTFPDEDQYRFAAEVAARFIERRDGVSLDDIIADPETAKEFDSLAARIAPGYRPVEYRWAALNLRKARRFKPEIVSRVVAAEDVRFLRVSDVKIDELPSQQGLYIFFTTTCALYVGEAANLQSRIRKHLDHSDNKGLARWCWDQGSESLHLELQVLPTETVQRVRRALETELIRSRNPLFNVKR